MKKLLAIMLIMLASGNIYAQDWITVGGNNQRNGRTGGWGPRGEFEHVRRPSLPTIWGNQIFVNGGKFVTTRYLSLNPIRAVLACHKMSFTMDTLWTKNYADNGVMIVMGFRDNQIYARNFQQQGFDTIYAINPENGEVIWKSRHTVERGIIWTAAFADDGDLIIPGSGTKSVMRIDRVTGDTVWTRYRVIPNTGAECMCVFGNTVYTFEGGITTPKRLMAIDINTGAIKYYSQTLPGDGDQEIPFSIGGDGTIFVVRDGGDLHALQDNGSAIVQLWQKTLPGPVGTYSTFGITYDDDLLIGAGKRVYKIDSQNGNLTDSTEELISSGTLNARIAVESGEFYYVGNGASVPSEGKYFAFDRFLKTLWTDPVPYNYYSGPTLMYGAGFPGMLYCGAGTEITYVFDFASVNTETQSLPESITLFDNYPNPFNPETRIRFELNRAETVSLLIYNAAGALVENIPPARYQTGMNEVKWNAGSRPSGVYLCRIVGESGSLSTKMILIR